MSLDRRELLHSAAHCALGSALLPAVQAPSSRKRPIRAVVFDAFPIFDPRPVAALAEEIFPGRGPELTNAWRTRQFEYQWLRALGGRYADFLQTTEEALIFSAKLLALDLRAGQRDRLMGAYGDLKVWPDALGCLRTLRAARVKTAFLSNMTEAMLTAGIRKNGLESLFDHVLSTNGIRTYKPDPRAYSLGRDVLHLRREEILFVAFAGWDAAGATWFGYPTAWVNRLGAPPEDLGAAPRVIGKDLSVVVRYVAQPTS